jgi:leucyl/phenylalanyl-tRNA--protein transferase
VPIFLLNSNEELFPPAEVADDSGILAVGGSVTPRRLLAAYRQGIFPWYSEGQPILWHSPDPRFVLLPPDLHVAKSLQKPLKKARFTFTMDTAFESVIGACAEVPRPGQSGTWITADMRNAYVELHRLGYAHSAEAWVDRKLVGGLYGVSLGNIFFGESMFTLVPDASKVAFVQLVTRLSQWGCELIDCQAETQHLSRFGAQNWPRSKFLRVLRHCLLAPTKRGPWTDD